MDELEKLYGVVNQKGLYTKSLEEFKAQYSNSESQEKLFKVVSERNLYTKSKDEFIGKYFAPTKIETPKKKDNTQQTTTSSSEGTESVTSSPNKVGSAESLKAIKQQRSLDFVEKTEQRGQESGTVSLNIEQPQTQPQTNTQPELKPKEKESWGSNLYRQLQTGSSDLGAMMASIPESVYNVFSIPQNVFSSATGIDVSTSADKFKEDKGIKNSVLDFYTEEVDRLEKETDKYNEKFDTTGIYDNITKGNYGEAFELLAGGITRSAPVSMAMMAGGATVGSVGKLSAVTTPLFVEGNLQQLKEENPDMGEAEATVKALGMAGAETLFASIGTGTLGKVYKDILLKEGKEEGAKVFKQGLIQMYESALKKYGLVASAGGEGIEEVATQITQNMISGKDATEGVADAFLQGVGGGALYGTPLTVKNTKDIITEEIDKNKINKQIKNTEFSTIANVFDFNENGVNGLALDLTKNKSSKKILQKQLEAQVLKGDITESDADRAMSNFDKTSAINNQFEGLDINESQKTEIANLLIEKNQLTEVTKGKDEYLVTKEKSRISEINRSIESIVNRTSETSQPETTNTSFDPSESEGTSLARLSQPLEGLEGQERETKAREIAKEHAESYFEYVNTQENAESILATDNAINFEENAYKALIKGDKADATQEETSENGSRVDEQGNPIPEAEFLVNEGKIDEKDIVEDEVSPTVQLELTNTEVETTQETPIQETTVKVKPFKKGDGGTKGTFINEDGQIYKSTTPLARELKDGKVVFTEIEKQTNEHKFLSENQDLKHLVKVGELVETSEGMAFEMETLSEVEEGSLTLDEINQINETITELNNRNVSINDRQTVMRRHNGEIVLVDLSTASENNFKDKEEASYNVVDLLGNIDRGRYDAQKRSEYLIGQRELFNLNENNDGYTYFLTQRPPSIGTHPLGQTKDVEPVKLGNRQAYRVTYDNPLTEEQRRGSELTEEITENDIGRSFQDGGKTHVINSVNGLNEIEIETFAGKNSKKEIVTQRTFTNRILNNSEEVTVKKGKTNEAVPTTNIEPDGSIGLSTDESANTTENTDVQPTIEPTTSETEVEVNQPTLTEEQTKQNALVDAKNQYNKLPVSRRRRAEGSQLLNTVNQLASDLGFKVEMKNAKLSVIGNNGKQAGKIAFKEVIPTASKEDIYFATNEINNGILNWDGDPLTPRVDLGISRADARKGEADIKKGNTNTVPAKRVIEAIKEAKENGEYETIQGSGGQIVRDRILIGQTVDSETQLTIDELNEIQANENENAVAYDTWFNNLDEQTQTEILDDYENTNNSTEVSENAEIGEIQENVSNEQETEPTAKQERIKIANAKIDDIANAIKNFEIGGVKFSIDDIDGVNQNGINIVDTIASMAKKAVEAGVNIDEAIQQIITHLKKTIDFDVSIDDVKARMQPISSFIPQQGKRSVLLRAYEGNNPSPLKELIDKNGMNYDVINTEETEKRAVAFVNDVGIKRAIEAADNNEVKGAYKAAVYGAVINKLTELSDNATADELNQIAKDYNSVYEVLLKLAAAGTEGGQYNAQLRKVYENSGLDYNYEVQVGKYKAINNGEISEELLTKFKETDALIKELNAKLKVAEEARSKAEAQQSIDDIIESSERTSPKNQNNKQKAKSIANNLRKAKILRPDVFSSAAPVAIIWDGAIETVAKAIEAGGSLADSIQKGKDYIKQSDWYKNLSNDKQNEALNSLEQFVDTNTKEKTISISEDGKISIPESTIRQYVEEGMTDIDEISQRIIDELLPNEGLTVRDVRDAITKYGKTANLDKGAISTEVRRLKRVGKLISSLEDVLSGNRPKRSGLQRDKATQKERELLAEINDKLRDLPRDEYDIEASWKTALDKTKTRLQNSIDDLQKQIDNKEKRKIKREPLVLDDDAKILKARRDELREELDNLVGKPELSYEERVKRSEEAVQRSIDNIQEQIATGNVEYKKSPTALNSEKLTELREIQKELKSDLEFIREEVGVAEAKRLEQAKKRIINRTNELERKLKEKDFAKKEPKKIPQDEEIADLKAELRQAKDVYDKAKYEAELKNRTKAEYARELFIGLVNIPRMLTAGGEMSMVLIQGGIQTVSLATRSPKKLIDTLKKAFKAVGSQEFTDKYEAKLKSSDSYLLMQETKLGLTEADYKMTLREETFIGNNLVYGVWNAIGRGIENGVYKVTGKKEFETIGSKLISLIKKDSEKKIVSISKQFKNLNPLLAMERGNTVYMNEIRRMRFLDGVDMLKQEGKNTIDHIEDYKAVAKAINTMTGRASIASLESANDIISTVFFSFKNTVSTFQQLNPYFYMVSLRNRGDKYTKPSVAQKMAVGDMVRFVGITTSMMLLLKAAAGDDEDGNPIFTIEIDPRSSDFGKLRWKNARFDPWHGMMPQLVYLSRLITDEKKKEGGDVEVIGKGYNSDTQWDNFMRVYVENKFSPSMQIAFRQMDANIDKDGNKTRFGKTNWESTSFVPMYLESLDEIRKEDPNAYVMFLSALGFFGLNSQVYESKKQIKKKKVKASSSGIEGR